MRNETRSGPIADSISIEACASVLSDAKAQESMRTPVPAVSHTQSGQQVIFPAEGAAPYKPDLTNLEFHLLDTGHFARDSAFLKGA